MKKWIQLTAGLIISALFMYFAFRNANFPHMWDAFKKADYLWILPAVAAMFASYWLRSMRWRYLMAPIKKVAVPRLFHALLIGYMANSFLPAHLGEVIRAYIIGQKENLPSSTVFASILVERVTDVFSLIAVMGAALFIFPFPGWVRRSGYVFLAVVVVLFAALLYLRIRRARGEQLVNLLLKPFPAGLRDKVSGALSALLDGVAPLKKTSHYIKAFLLTVLIWACYAASFYIVFFSFNFNRRHGLGWLAALVLLVMTTIGILIPSSPGYVGVFHFLCQAGLGLFGVSSSESLSYAFIMHGVNFIPVVLAGLILVGVSGKGILKMPPGTPRTEKPAV